MDSDETRRQAASQAQEAKTSGAARWKWMARVGGLNASYVDQVPTAPYFDVQNSNSQSREWKDFFRWRQANHEGFNQAAVQLRKTSARDTFDQCRASLRGDCSPEDKERLTKARLAHEFAEIDEIDAGYIYQVSQNSAAAGLKAFQAHMRPPSNT